MKASIKLVHRSPGKHSVYYVQSYRGNDFEDDSAMMFSYSQKYDERLLIEDMGQATRVFEHLVRRLSNYELSLEWLHDEADLVELRELGLI